MEEIAVVVIEMVGIAEAVDNLHIDHLAVDDQKPDSVADLVKDLGMNIVVEAVVAAVAVANQEAEALTDCMAVNYSYSMHKASNNA